MKTKHIGNLEIRKGDNTDYSKLKEITGYLRTYGSAKLDALTSVGGYLYIDGSAKLDAPALTSVGGYLHIDGSAKLDAPFVKNVTWKSIDGTLFVIDSEKNTKGIKIYSGYILESLPKGQPKKRICFVAEKNNFFAHAETLKKAIMDLQFKIVSEKLKNEPIKKDTKFTVKYYRTITGACDLGVRAFLESNNIPFNILNRGTESEETILVDSNQMATSITAFDLSLILEKSKPYGYQKFKKLLTF